MADAGKAGRKPGLNAQQERFCREYVVDMSGTAAAGRAGYKGDLGHQATVLLKKPHVQELVAKLKAKQFAKLELKAENVLQELSRIGFVDPAELFDLEGVMLPIRDIPEGIRRAIASIKVQTVYSGSGVNRTEIGRSLEVKFWSKVDALETLGKHFKLWVDRLEISGRVDVADALRKARERRVQALTLVPPAKQKPSEEATA